MLPYTLLRQQESPVQPGPESAVPLFPVLGAEGADGLSVQVTRRGDDTLVAVAAPAAGAATTMVRGAIIDISRLHQDHAAARHTLRLETTVSQGAAAPFQSFTLETSDDLQHWATLQTDGQLVHLEHDGQRIDRDSVSWDGATGRYLRLLWATPEHAPAISAALVRSSALAGQPAPLVWSAALAAQSSKAGQYDYALPGQMPLEQLRIGLAQTNTLAPVTVQRYWPASGRRRDGDGNWQTIDSSVIFRLQGPKGDVNSPEIALHQPPASRLRLVVDQRGGGIGQQAPTVQVGFTPAALLFLARGDGPYTLAWGASKVAPAELAPATLMPGYVPGQPPAAAVASLQAVAAPAPPIGETNKAPVSKGVLWAVLVAGGLVLASMAALLVRQMKNADPQ